MTESRPIHFRCLGKTCRHIFDLAPRLVARGDSLVGHRVTDGACPVCGSQAGRLSWYGLITQMKAEAAVRDRLKAAGNAVLWLHYLVEVKRTNRTTASRRHSQGAEPVKVRRPVLPSGYVFARMTTSDIAAARALPGVAGFCGTEAGAGPIPDAQMKEFLDWGDENGCVALGEPSEARRGAFQVGDWVRVLDGSFEGLEYPVAADDGKQLVEVTATIFGRETPLKLPYWQIELVRKAA